MPCQMVFPLTICRLLQFPKMWPICSERLFPSLKVGVYFFGRSCFSALSASTNLWDFCQPGDNGLHFYRTQVLALPCLVNESVACEDADFTLPLLVNVESNCWICQSCYMDYPILIYGFVTTVPCISRPLPNKTKLKFD